VVRQWFRVQDRAVLGCGQLLPLDMEAYLMRREPRQAL